MAQTMEMPKTPPASRAVPTESSDVESSRSFLGGSFGSSGLAAPLVAGRRRRWGRRLRNGSDARSFAESEGGGWGNACREYGFLCFFVLLCVTCAGHLCVLKAQDSQNFGQIAKLWSIPLVGVVFTWAHIWLAIQMMFYPLRFWGLWNYKNTGNGIGWQGVVPRKAGIMAEKTCELMVGSLITMEEILDRIQVDEFFNTLGTVLKECQKNVNEKLGSQYFPSLYPRIPQSVKDELLTKVLEMQEENFVPIMGELRGNIREILDIKDMCVTRYTNEPTLLIALFQQVGNKEFMFIQRVGAQMGLLCGLVQMSLYFVTKDIDWPVSWVLLPSSALVIGLFTNWMAIKMIFEPTHPHYFCCGRFNFQGLFLKRQKQVSRELATLLTDTCVNAEMLLKYLASSPGYEKALEIFRRHIAKACDEVVGSFGSFMPMAVGNDGWANLKEDVVKHLMEELPKHSSQFLKFVDQVIAIEETMSKRLAELPPDQFEGMLHPAFKEDEWLLILAGGALGVVVGFFQAWVLGA